MEEKAIRMEDILNEDSSSDDDIPNICEISEENKKKISFEQDIPKGKPKSGRIWKEPKKRFSSIVKSRGIKLSFEKKQKLKENLQRAKDMSRAIKEKKQAEKEAKKQRRIENLKRAEENRKKGEVVQIIKNTAKLKRMKKKQLRFIEKRDTN
ncbi:PREDICTED: coiled-coil domain-containing protein 86 [Polistes dominula]|uniref:Coiled-coil domain-containing protein 86 n=1 Tax=Polistes dominula TaxID=743375 RepID=A0ABM1IUB9_POLDO|nr:PREDICTED: coiled-coil domain-containing protein 86 [Polistes dominula]XP_015183807.1 PREDICTED: coiled-coil domain-containing protein 86 [Polistes dominula]XP_015183808.1 PREDICTED: coiled-coil domain-containing protein 86 [Polistes dominula]